LVFGFGFGVLGLGFRVSGSWFGFRGSGSGSGSGFRVSGFRLRVSSLGFHLVFVWGLGVGV